MRRFLSSAARRAEADAALKAAAADAVWSRTPEARAIMVPPPPELLDDAHRHDILQCGSTQQWLQFRKWGSLLASGSGSNSYTAVDGEADNFTDSPAFRVLSHTLTFPLTVARYANVLNVLPQKELEEGGRTLAVVIAGARAEASLPTVWWREALLMLGPSVDKLQLYFVGPEATGLTDGQRVREVAVDLGPGRSPGAIAWSTHRSTLGAFWASPPLWEQHGATAADVGAGTSASRVSSSRVPLAAIGAAEKVSRASLEASLNGPPPRPAPPAPALVWLSNPGLGHPAVMDAWAPDLTSLLVRPPAASTPAPADAYDGTTTAASMPWPLPRCPVLVTSHSANDQARDWNAVTEVLATAGVDRNTSTSERSEGAQEGAPSLTPPSPTPQSMSEPWLAMAPEGPAPFRSRRAVADAIEGGAVAANWGAFAVRAVETAPRTR